MSKVAVIDTEKKPLAPCHPAVARRLLKHGRAAIWRKYPFTIILKKSIPTSESVTEKCTLSIDPGYKATGLAVVSESGDIVFAAALHHRGRQIKKALQTRSGFRRGRRTRNLRYRPARWANRKRKVPVLTENGWDYQRAEVREGEDARKSKNVFNRVSLATFLDTRYRWERLPRTKSNKKKKMRWRRIRIEHQRVADNGWIAPSLMSRVFNLETWTRRLCKIYPITQLAIENVKFDMQLLEDPDLHGNPQYQQGTLHGYEIREYLLELTWRKCAYCGTGGVPLQVEHIRPKARGGSNRPDNLTMACQPCNEKKGNLWGEDIKEQLGEDFAKKVKKALAQSEKGLADAAAVNTIRWKLVETLKATGLPVLCGTGGKTAYHRNRAGLPKTHYYDAASVAHVPKQPKILYDKTGSRGIARRWPPKHKTPLRVAIIKAVGYGRRDLRKFSVTKPGFNYGERKRSSGDGFRKFDHVEIKKLSGKRKEKGIINCFDNTPKGRPCKLRVAYFNPKVKDPRISGNTKELRLIQRRDGYSYDTIPAKAPSPRARKKQRTERTVEKMA